MAETVKFKTSGMHCNSCSMLIQMNVGDLNGVASVKADFASGMTEVAYDPAVITPDEICQEIRNSGYEAERI